MDSTSTTLFFQFQQKNPSKSEQLEQEFLQNQTEGTQNSPCRAADESKSVRYDEKQEEIQAKQKLLNRIASAVKGAIGNSGPSAQVLFNQHIRSLGFFFEMNKDAILTFVEEFKNKPRQFFENSERTDEERAVMAAVSVIKQFGIHGRGGGSLPLFGTVPQFQIPTLDPLIN